jgi:fumarylacetoacetate (FAA) hydrolase
MKLASLSSAGRDGALVVVSRDGVRAASATPIATTLQDALDRWVEVETPLRALAGDLEAGRADATAFDKARTLAPLPRAWQWLDGSAFLSHGALMQTAFKLPPHENERPLMYQGMSHKFLAPTEDVPLPDEADGIDFEGEFGVIVDETPMGVTPDQALRHIRLIVQINDWSLRTLAPVEMKTGFGWIHAKPACSMAPLAVTPDELGKAWKDGRVCLPLRVWCNGALFGEPNGNAMAYGFHELVAHAARTRGLCAGTIVGSGTVSNPDYRTAGSTCIAERRGIEMIDTGAPQTAFMHFGDRVRMEAEGGIFGAIDQRVISRIDQLRH